VLSGIIELMKKALTITFSIIILAILAYGSSILYCQVKGKEDRAGQDIKIESVNDQTSNITLEKVPAHTSLVFAGDAMFDRNVWHNYKDRGLLHIFDNLNIDIFKSADYSILNLEGPISSTEIDDDCCSGSMVFNFPPETTSALNYLGIDAVSLANNHTMNAGASGFSYTKSALEKSKIKYFGKQVGFSEDSILRLDGDIQISVIGIDTLATYNEDQLEESIKIEKATGRFVIIMPHWGTEYRETHNSNQRALAGKWAEAGADMIVGSHPHVVEDFEVIDPLDDTRGKPVVYSLGNFVFDQYFSKETQEGLALKIDISESDFTIRFLPTESKKSAVSFTSDLECANRIKKIFDITSNSGFERVGEDMIKIRRR
jgi:poly-gamma-glutamate synthesis protein (capsule biosynthesis protein)